ncbi:MAG: putative histidine kinase, classic [Bryobacterales bacterium]|nr:putative histidine kinase, classic [Bryobacterales bacterium]
MCLCGRDNIVAMGIVAQPGWASGAERFRSLYQLLAALSRASALEDVYEAALTSLLDATGADRAAILLFDEDGVIRFKASRGLSPEYQEAVTGHCPWPRGTRTAEPIVVPDVLLEGALAAYGDVLRREEIRALVFVPLALDAGVFGKFMLYYAEPHECVTEELEIASAIAAHVALATEHKRAELARTRSEQRLAAIVENSDDAIVSKDLNGIITSWNSGAERLFGYTADEAVGKPVAMLAAPERLDEMPAILAKIKAGDRVEHYETRRRRKDGQVIDVALTVSPVRNAAGEIVGASKIARDISDRRRAEQERALLHSREQEARRTAELLNRVAPRLAAQLDIEKLVQEVTDIATTLVGAEFGAFFHNVTNEKGESYMLYSLSGVPREAFASFPMPRNTDLFGATFRGEAVFRCEDVTQDPRYGKNPPYHGMPKGHVPVRSYLAAPVIAQSREVLGGLFFGHSAPGRFTETHEAVIAGLAAQASIAMDNARLFEQAQWAQSELKRSNEELRRTNQDLEMFAYSASHDLQEPLRTISISAQLIEREWGQQLKGEDSMFLTNILAASNRMSVLIEDLLAYTRATKYEEGSPPYVDSAQVLANVLTGLLGTIEQTGATVTAGKLPMVAIHESRLAQVFQNLIGNAIKYRSEEVCRVHVTADERDGWCVFSVADNGIGIESKYAERIFGLFKRLHGRDEYPGSGIGLAICQRVVEQYGGRIWLEHSEPGRGSTFCFSIPSRTH